MRSLFDTIAPRYDLVNRIMSFGLDVRWRKASMKKLSAPGGSVVIDLACGTGDFCREIEKAGMVPVGLDLSMGMLAAARTGAPLVHADILAMPLADGSVDGATCGFAPQPDRTAGFLRRGRSRRASGRTDRISRCLTAREPDHPVRTRHLLQPDRPGHRRPAERGSGLQVLAEIGRLPAALARARAQLEAAGFVDIERKVFTGAHLFTATRGA